MSEHNIPQIEESIEKESKFINDIYDSIKKVIIGQDNLIQKLLIAMLSNGHIFLEGVPGLAKTLIIKSFAQIINTKFQRLQLIKKLNKILELVFVVAH